MSVEKAARSWTNLCFPLFSRQLTVSVVPSSDMVNISLQSSPCFYKAVEAVNDHLVKTEQIPRSPTPIPTPPKHGNGHTHSLGHHEQDSGATGQPAAAAAELMPKRKRGRPPKQTANADACVCLPDEIGTNNLREGCSETASSKGEAACQTCGDGVEYDSHTAVKEARNEGGGDGEDSDGDRRVNGLHDSVKQASTAID
jgi:hypothetical protein